MKATRHNPEQRAFHFPRWCYLWGRFKDGDTPLSDEIRSQSWCWSVFTRGCNFNNGGISCHCLPFLAHFYLCFYSVWNVYIFVSIVFLMFSTITKLLKHFYSFPEDSAFYTPSLQYSIWLEFYILPNHHVSPWMKKSSLHNNWKLISKTTYLCFSLLSA